jgi:Xaa-Pro aminopeptidase
MSDVLFLSPGFSPQRFSSLMNKYQYDAILLASPENVYYATGFPSIHSAGNPILYTLRNVLPYYAFLDREGNAALLCWGGAAAGVQFSAQQVITFPDAVTARQKLSELLAQKEKQIRRIGLESTCPLETYRTVENLFDAGRIALCDELIGEMRLIKSSTEIEYMKKSTAIVEQTVSELMGLLRIGISRPELIYEAKTRMLKNGATGVGHVTISFGSSNPEVEIDEQLQPGKLVVLDLGALYLGYASDNRRLLYSGKVPAGMHALHATMCDIVDEVADQMKPGASFDELYRLALQLYKKNKLDPFIPNVGHSIGLNTEEAWIYKDSPVVVQPGMVINLELYSLYETGELIGDEETYYIDDLGAHRMTSLPRPIKQIS